jgi:MHS family proline/betaine transporter-like MFS transporter
VFGLLIAPVGLYMRYRMDESREFLDARDRVSTAPVVETADDARGTLNGIGVVIGLCGFASPVVYLILIFMPGYAARELGMGQTVPMVSTLDASTLLVPAAGALVGRLCDRVGSKPT